MIKGIITQTDMMESLHVMDFSSIIDRSGKKFLAIIPHPSFSLISGNSRYDWCPWQINPHLQAIIQWPDYLETNFFQISLSTERPDKHAASSMTANA
jgi:hypothetical protein